MEELYTLLFQENQKFLCYRTSSGYGITAFFHRFCYLYRATDDVICLSAELSDTSRSPLHAILKNIVKKSGRLYHLLQTFADDYYGEDEEPLLKSIILDLPAGGETLANLLFSKQTAHPIYTGYYSDAAKQFFYEMVKNPLRDKKVLIFIDNAQFIDNESIYDIFALLQMSNVSCILSQSGESPTLDKLLMEIDQVENIRFVDFPEPSVECVKEILENSRQSASDADVRRLIQQTNGNIRKIVFEAKYTHPLGLDTVDSLHREILSLLLIIKRDIRLSDLFSMLKESPTYSLCTVQDVKNALRALTYKGMVSSILQINGEEIFQARIRNENRQDWDSILPDSPDKLIYQDIVYKFLSAMSAHTVDDLRTLFDLSKSIKPQHTKKWGKALLVESLSRGLSPQNEWINAVKASADPQELFLCALCTYRLWKYKETLEILVAIWPHVQGMRDAIILRALTLNRCRKHGEADELLSSLEKTSSSVDERAMILSMQISNCIHSGNEGKAVELVSAYENELMTAKTFGYFLRNAATLFQGEQARDYWERSIQAFKEAGDEYGELTTLVNMTRTFIRAGKAEYALSCMTRAYNGLMPYGVEQLHIAANNLGVAFFSCGDISNAKKHLRIARLITKSLMPRVYITINDCMVMLHEGQPMAALEALLKCGSDVNASNLPRLKSRYYLALAGIYCILNHFSDALNAITESNKYSVNSFSALRKRIENSCKTRRSIPRNQWNNFFAPAYLEYWIANPLSIMSKDVLSGQTLLQN